MAKYVYPAVFTPEESGYSILFPDLDGCCTQGNDIIDGMEMAKDVLCLTLYGLEEDDKEIPAPSAVNDVPRKGNEFVTLVFCDTIDYRRYFDNRAVKKTLTIPSWLNDMAERNGINFSGVLQEALKEKLNV